MSFTAKELVHLHFGSIGALDWSYSVGGMCYLIVCRLFCYSDYSVVVICCEIIRHILLFKTDTAFLMQNAAKQCFY